MAPEQARGRQDRIGPRTDVYGLSAILYELLSRRPPFDGSEAGEILHLIQTQAPVPLPPAVPPDLAAICFKGLSKESADRYESAAELAADLRRFLDHRPTIARRPWWPRRLTMWAGRNRAAAAALGLLLLLSVVLAGASLWINHSRDEANIARGQAEETATRERRLKQKATRTVGDLLVFSDARKVDRQGREQLLGLVRPLVKDIQGTDSMEETVYLELGLECSQGDVALDGGDFAGAERIFSRVLDRLTEAPEQSRRKLRIRAALALMDVLYRAGQLDQATIELGRLLKTASEVTPQAGTPIPPEVAELYKNILRIGRYLARALEVKGQVAESENCLDQLIAAAETWPPTDLAAAQEHCELLFSRANNRLFSKERKKAVEDLTKAFGLALPYEKNLGSRDATTLVWRCHVRRLFFYTEVEPTKAELDLKRALELLPRADVEAWPLEDGLLMFAQSISQDGDVSKPEVLLTVQRLERSTPDGSLNSVVKLGMLACGYLMLATHEYMNGNYPAGDGWNAHFKALRERVKKQFGGPIQAKATAIMDSLAKASRHNKLPEEALYQGLGC
jgi:tetratricopeptide (TPR) repeat protein